MGVEGGCGGGLGGEVCGWVFEMKRGQWRTQIEGVELDSTSAMSERRGNVIDEGGVGLDSLFPLAQMMMPNRKKNRAALSEQAVEIVADQQRRQGRAGSCRKGGPERQRASSPRPWMHPGFKLQTSQPAVGNHIDRQRKYSYPFYRRSMQSSRTDIA